MSGLHVAYWSTGVILQSTTGLIWPQTETLLDGHSLERKPRCSLALIHGKKFWDYFLYSYSSWIHDTWHLYLDGQNINHLMTLLSFALLSCLKLVNDLFKHCSTLGSPSADLISEHLLILRKVKTIALFSFLYERNKSDTGIHIVPWQNFTITSYICHNTTRTITFWWDRTFHHTNWIVQNVSISAQIHLIHQKIYENNMNNN